MSNGATHMFKNGLTLLGYHNGFGPNGICKTREIPIYGIRAKS